MLGCRPRRHVDASQRADDDDVLTSFVTRYGTFDPRARALPVLPQLAAHGPLRALSAQHAAVDTREVRLVQCVGRIEPFWRAAIEAMGLSVVGYIPHNTLLVRVQPNTPDVHRLQRLPFVRLVADAAPALKLDPRLLDDDAQVGPLPPGSIVHGHVADEVDGVGDDELVVDVTLRDADARGSLAPFLVAGGARLFGSTRPGLWPDPRVLRVVLSRALLAPLAERPEVWAIEPSFRRRLFNDRSYGIMQAGQLFDAAIWRRGLRGQGQMVAFADTGLNRASCFFRGRDKIAFYEDVAQDGGGDDDGHGTHVGGTIAGDNFGNRAYDMHDGMAPAAQLYVQDVAAGDELVGLDEDLSPLFASAYDGGARIHSNSWGDDDNTYGALARSVDDFVWQHRDFLVVAAVGNDGAYGAQTVGSPATAKNLIAVGAHNGASIEDVAYFSSRGPTADGRIKPTLVAPGMAVVSASHRGGCTTQTQSGTSMAAPGLAGAAALVRQYFMDGFYPAGAASPDEGFIPSAALIKAVLLAGAEDMRGAGILGRLPANGQGFGRMKLSDSLIFTGDVRRLWVEEESDGLQTDEEVAFRLTVEGGGALHVALTWFDVPAAPGAARALVNNLDLEVSGPAGTWLGNAPGSRGSKAAARPDVLNVEEVVHVPRAKPGQYTVVVRATHVPLGPQPYALAVVARLVGEVELAVAP